MLKDALMSAPISQVSRILRSLIQFLQMQANMGGLAYSLQEHTSVIDGREVTTNHPVSICQWNVSW